MAEIQMHGIRSFVFPSFMLTGPPHSRGPQRAAALGWKAAARDALTALCLGVSVAKPVDAGALPLPRDSQSELRRTAVVSRGDDAPGRIRNVVVRVAEVVVIQNVEDLGPEFDAGAADRKPL